MRKTVFSVFVIIFMIFGILSTPQTAQAAIALSVKASLTPGTYYADSAKYVSLSSYPGSVIVYTTNGTLPQVSMNTFNVLRITNGYKYTGSIYVKGSRTIKAVAILNWYTPKSSVYTFTYNVQTTAPVRAGGTSGVYYLPWARGATYSTSRVGGAGHVNAIDFVLPNQTAVYAARSGYVKYVVQSNTQSGCISTLPANYIAIEDRSNGEVAYYVHIATNSSRVAVGQYVSRGTIIAKSSNIGYSCGTGGGYHLHFDVRKNGTRLMPFFADVAGGTVKPYTSYTSGGEIRY